MFPDNDWYSNKKILFDFCGIEKTYPIKATLQHGWYPFYDKYTIKNNKYCKSAPYLCWSKKFRQFFSRRGVNIKSIGSPFLYLCKIKGKISKKVNGTILFPSHSAPEFKQYVDHEKIIQIVAKNYEPPFSVCLFYTDYKKKIIKLYKKKNFKVYCCGSRADENFLYNFYNIVLNVKTCIFMELNSALMYCMYLKKVCKIHDKDKFGNILCSHSSLMQKKNTENYFLYKYLTKDKISKNKLFRIACNELGYKELKKPEELIEILGLKNIFNNLFAYIFSKLHDIKFGKTIRLGLKDNKYSKHFKKYNPDYIEINSKIKKY
jgi:hypothetical protein